MLSDALLGAPRRPHLEPPPPPAADLVDTADEPPPAIAVPPVQPANVHGAPRAASEHAPASAAAAPTAAAAPSGADAGHASSLPGAGEAVPARKPPAAEPPVEGESATEVAVAAQSHSPPQAAPVPPATPGAVAEHVKHAGRPQHGIAPSARSTSRPIAELPAAAAVESHDAGAEDTASAPAPTPVDAPEIAGGRQPVRFAAGEDAEKTEAAHDRLDAFTGDARLRITALHGLVDSGARALVPRLGAAEQAIDAAKQQNQRAVDAVMAELRQQTEAKVRAARGDILAHHGRALATIRGATAAAQAQLDGQIEAALEAVTAGEARSAPLVDAAYAAGDARFRQTGAKVGNEALAVGAQYRENWLSKLDGKSTLLSGAVHDNKLKARANAADETAAAYHKELVASAAKQADAAKAGKAHDREALSAAAAAHRDAILAVRADAHAGLEHAETSAIDAADGQRDRDLALLAAQRDTSLGTIGRKGHELGREVVKHAAAQKQALRGFVESAVSHSMAGLRAMGEALDGSMVDLRARAATTEAPHVDELEPALAGQRSRLNEGAAGTEARLREALATAEQQIATAQDQSVQGLGDFAAMVRQAAGQIGSSISQTVAAFTRHSGEGFASVEKGHAESVRGVVGGAVRASQDVAASSATAFSGLVGNLGTGFDKGAEGLEGNLRGALKDLRPQIEKAADQADKQVQPRWKKVLKVLVVVAVIVVVAVVAGPAVIGAVGAMAGALGASAAVAGAIGTIVGGAVVGAASGAVMQISNNVIDGNKWYEGVGTAMAMGAISGVFGGVGGLAAKGLTSVAIGSLVAMGFDTAGSVVANLATGQPVTLEGLAVGLAIGVGVSVGSGALGRFGGRLGKKVESLRGRSEEAGKAAGEKVGGLLQKPSEPAPAPAPAPTTAPAVEEHVLSIEADTLAGERPSANTPERTDAPAPLELTEVDGAQIPKVQDTHDPIPEFTGEDIELNHPVEELGGPTTEMPRWEGTANRPSPRSDSADYMKEQLPRNDAAEPKVKPPKITAFGGDEPTVDMPAPKPGGGRDGGGGPGGGPTFSEKRPNGGPEGAPREAALDDVLDSLEAEQVATKDALPAQRPAGFEELEARMRSETDPRKKLEVWRDLHSRRAQRAASESIHTSRNDSSLAADQQTRRMEATARIMDSTLDEIEEEIAHLQADWHLRGDDENLARVNELIERKSLEHAIETRYNVNITNDIDANAGSVHPDYEPTTRSSWSIDELRSMESGLGRLPPEHILGDRLLPPRVLPDGRYDSRMPGLEIRRAEVLREFLDGRWQNITTSGGAHLDGVIKVFDGGMASGGHNMGRTDPLAGHAAGGSRGNGPTTGIEDIIVHEVGHNVEDLHGKRVGATLASEPGSVSEAFRAAGGWSTAPMTRQQALDVMMAPPPAGCGMAKAAAEAQLVAMDGTRGNFLPFETPRIATGDRVFQVDRYDDAGYLSRARNALPEASFDEGYWTYARTHPAESFAEQYSAAVHSPNRYHKDMIATPARNVATAEEELETAKAMVAAAREDAAAKRAQAQLTTAKSRLDRALAAQSARRSQYDIMRNTVFKTDAAARAAESRLAATPVSAGREADRAARIARFRTEVEVAATPQQVERLRAQAEADIRGMR